MKRIHPLFSLLSLSFALILFAGLGFIVWRNGSLLFSPGELSAVNLAGMALGGFASHADFEKTVGPAAAQQQTGAATGGG